MIAFTCLARFFRRSAILLLPVITGIFCCIDLWAQKKPSSTLPFRVLVFSKTVGYYHHSIPAAWNALRKLGEENNLLVDTTTDAGYFVADSLKNYSSVIFLSTSGDVLNDTQQQVFREYIESGGGFVGIHSATDTEYDWPWYGHLVGAWFSSHPKIQAASLNIVDKNHLSTKGLSSPWIRTDEWYNFKNMDSTIKVLITVDESSYEGGTHGKVHPVAWYHQVGKGRSFYTSSGHSEESYSEPAFLIHLLGGINYANGKD